MSAFQAQNLGAGVLSVLSLLAGCHSSPSFSDVTTERAVTAAGEVSAPQLRSHIEALLKERQKEEPVASMFWGGMPLRRHNAASYIDSYLTGLGLTPVHERERQNEIDTENIYVDLPSSSTSAHATDLVLITGHYDNWHLGADDNASAVAVLLETAQILRKKNLSRTVRIIAFDREEEGLIGSDRYANRHAGDHLTAMINMDCVGYSSSKPGSQSAPPGLALRDVGDFLGILASAPGAGILSSVTKLSRTLPSPVGVLGLIAPANGHDAAAAAFLRSDHAPFWRQGVPVLFLTDTANFRNPHYHRSTDLPETLDYDFLARNAALVVAATVALAEEG